MTDRLQHLQQWLQTHLKLDSLPQLVAITNDASFRRYFRVMAHGISYAVMDAPPDKENCTPYVKVARSLRAQGLNAPAIIADDLTQGFLLLTDLGSQLYLAALDETRADALYQDALTALLVMQQIPSDDLPLYDHRLLHNEMDLFTHWLLGKHLNLLLTTTEKTALATIFELLSDNVLTQPQVFVHRDYHSRNLMVVPQHNPGILDFQDAVKGAVTYDLVSLLRDCYIAWPLAQVHDWTHRYYQMAKNAKIIENIDEVQFLRWFDWMGVQRHLKASGIFARLYHRDGKDGYLKDIPRTLNYIVRVSENYPELMPLGEFISQRVLPTFQQTLLCTP